MIVGEGFIQFQMLSILKMKILHNLRRAGVCLVGRNTGRLQGAPPPTPPWDVGVAGI